MAKTKTAAHAEEPKIVPTKEREAAVREERRRRIRERAPIDMVTLEVPVTEGGKVTSTYLELRLTPRQALGLRMLFDGLQAEGIETRTIALGKPRAIESTGDAVRWVLDEIVTASESPEAS